MPDNKIKELLKKYLNGTATPEECRLVNDWYDSLSDEKKEHKLSDLERVQMRNHYWDRLKSRLDESPGNHEILWKHWTALAAAIAGLVVVAYFYFPSFLASHPANPLSGLGKPALLQETFENHTDAVRHITLSDSSRVMLFPGSVLGIYREFNIKERKVDLSGRAFFDVQRNEARPFYVLANEVVTKVLGTSFTVTAYPEAPEITVAVTSGTVSVYADKEDQLGTTSQKVVLSPNQQAIYNRSEQKVSRTLVEVPKVVISDEEVKKIRFEGVPVSEIFKALEKMYGVDIQFDEETFAKCSMTTSVSRGDLYEKIDVICEITGSEYTLEDTSIRISGVGCN